MQNIIQTFLKLYKAASVPANNFLLGAMYGMPPLVLLSHKLY